MSNKFFSFDFSTKKQKKIDSETTESGYTVDSNGNSLLGTMWSVSTSAIAGLTESVITPGIRFIKFVAGIMQIYKRLQHNLNTITTKVERITSIINAFSTGKHNHIRKSVVKCKVKIK